MPSTENHRQLKMLEDRSINRPVICDCDYYEEHYRQRIPFPVGVKPPPPPNVQRLEGFLYTGPFRCVKCGRKRTHVT